MNDLTQKQQTFLTNLSKIYGSRALSSLETIKEELNFKSKNSIQQYIKILISKNYIVKDGKHLYINNFGAPLMSHSVKAGFAGIMDDKIEKRISMDELFEINSPSTFVFKVSGDSMCEVGILDEDYVVIKKTSEAKINDIVLAIIDNEFTLKTYKKDKIGYFLQPENKDYPILRPKFSLSIFGVAIGITRRL